MANLLDAFLPSLGPSPYASLLGPEGAQALADNSRQSLAMNLLAASGPSRLPVSFGSALGQAYQQAAQQRGLDEQSALRLALTMPQIEESKRKTAEAQRVDALRLAAEKEAAGGVLPNVLAAPAMPMAAAPSAPGPNLLAASPMASAPMGAGGNVLDATRGPDGSFAVPNLATAAPSAAAAPAAAAGGGATMGPAMRAYLLAVNPAALQKEDALTKLGEGETLVDRTGRVVAQGNAKPGEVKNIPIGDREVPHTFDRAQGKWVPIPGAGGPRWQPDQTLTPVYDPNSPTGTTLLPRGAAANRPGAPQNGLKVTRDADGNFTVEQGPIKPGGPGTDSGLQKPEVAKIEEKMVANNTRMDRVGAIRSAFNPDFLKYSTQLQQTLNNVKEKAGMPLSAAQREQLGAYTQFRARAYEDLNQTLKEMSGSAVTDGEAKRQMKTLADAENDGPTQFLSKLNSTEQMLRMAQARLGYLRANGMNAGNNFGGITLDAVPALIDQRGKALEAQLQGQPGVDPATIRPQVLKKLSEEFGVPM